MKTPWWFLRKSPMAFMLVPASWVYNLVSRAVYHMRAIGAYTPRRPVVCIGNIFAGGVGKTPVVSQLAKYLNAPVVMRGYKKSAQTNNIGDEAAMLADMGLQVHTGHRKSNVMLLDRQDDNTPIVMDDGYQNPTVRKSVSVLVFDSVLGFGNGFILPAGPLRQGKRTVANADAILVVKSGKVRKNFMLPADVPVFYARPRTVNPYSRGTKIFAFAGIGYPKKFFDSIGGNVVGTRAFADHHDYTDADLARLFKLAARRGAKLLTTQKDWMRLPADAQREIKFAPLEMDIDCEFFDWIKEKTNAYVKARG